MIYATKRQIKAFHAALGAQKARAFKAEMVLEASGGRTSSSKELSFEEMKGLLASLNSDKQSGGKRAMMRKMAAIAHRIGWKTEDGQLDKARLDDWARRFGKFNKAVPEHTAKELVELLAQFEAVEKHYENRA